MASGFAAVWITGAWWVPAISVGHIALARVEAATLATLLLPFSFEIGMGVPPSDKTLKERLDAEIVRRHPEIQTLLRAYGIPQTSGSTEPADLAEN